MNPQFTELQTHYSQHAGQNIHMHNILIMQFRELRRVECQLMRVEDAWVALQNGAKLEMPGSLEHGPIVSIDRALLIDGRDRDGLYVYDITHADGFQHWCYSIASIFVNRV